MDGITSIIIFTVGALLGSVAGFVIARAMRGGDTVPRHEVETARADRQALEARLEERADKYKADIQTRLDEIKALQAHITTVSGELQNARERTAALAAEKEGLDKRVRDHKTDLEQMQEKMQLSFETLSNKIFDDKAHKFKLQSSESLDLLLNPLRDKLADFHKKVEDSFGTHAKEQFALKREIERIVEVSDKMTFQTDSLAKALRGDVKVQGNWGEVMLEKILADSGLRKGDDYVLQGAELGLRDAETGRAQRPDAIVMLPDSKHIIIDSKVSLVHYERYSAEEDEALRAGHLKDYLASVRSHVTGLEERRYQDTEKLGTPDVILMFLPIEGAYALAIQQDRNLHSFAWDKKIVLVCPATLFATLRTIASLWRIELQHRNVDEIARKGGELYDKIASFAEEMQRLGQQIKKADETYDSAFKKLTTGRGNILKKADDLKVLGAKTSKAIPQSLLGFDDDESEAAIRLVEQG